MAFEERNYSTEIYYPQPEVYFNEQDKLLIIATPWGERRSAKKVIQTISEFYLAATSDDEATSPFPRLPYLSPAANNLRIATLLANHQLYKEENYEEYTTAVEITVASISGLELICLQSGNPHILIDRGERGLIPLGTQPDLAFEVTNAKNNTPPLPNNLIGLDLNPNLKLNSLRAQANDKLVFISRSWLPQTIFANDERTVESLTRQIVLTNDQLPFWIGVWKT